MADISNTADIIDSRDIIERIEELEEYEQAIEDAERELQDAQDAMSDLPEDEDADVITSHAEEVETAKSNLESARDEMDGDEREELRVLSDLADEASGSPDWRYGEILIRDSYFTEYAQQLAEDCGMVDDSNRWPGRCIDWEAAADELKMDYFSVDYDGVEYWIRA